MPNLDGTPHLNGSAVGALALIATIDALGNRPLDDGPPDYAEVNTMLERLTEVQLRGLALAASEFHAVVSGVRDRKIIDNMGADT